MAQTKKLWLNGNFGCCIANSSEMCIPGNKRPTRPMYEFSCGRSSPIEGPAENTKSAAERERTNQLAQPKKVHSEYQASREVSDSKFSLEHGRVATRQKSRLDWIKCAIAFHQNYRFKRFQHKQQGTLDLRNGWNSWQRQRSDLTVLLGSQSGLCAKRQWKPSPLREQENCRDPRAWLRASRLARIFFCWQI